MDTATLVWYGALVFWSLLCVVDPIGGAATFLATTRDRSAQERRRLAGRAVAIGGLVLAAGILFGPELLFRVGIHTAGFRIGCGLLLLVPIVAEWGKGAHAFATAPLPVDADAPAARLAVTPLGFPLVASTSALATAILYAGEWDEGWRRGVTAACVVLTLAITWAAFRAAERLGAWLGPGGTRFATSVQKLTVAAWAVDFIATGVRDFLPFVLHTPPAR